MGSQMKEAILQAKWAANLSKKSKITLTFWIASYFLLISSTQVQCLDLPLPDLLPVTCNVILQRFTAQQQSSLEDYLELSVMLQYNLVH